MGKYKYIDCCDIENYDVENIIHVVAKNTTNSYAKCLIELCQKKPIQDYIKLHEATNEEIINELIKRLGGLNGR